MRVRPDTVSNRLHLPIRSGFGDKVERCLLLRNSFILGRILEGLTIAAMLVVSFSLDHATAANLDVRWANGGRLSFDVPSLAPIAFVRFCLRYPQDCKVRGSATQPELEPLTKSRKTVLAKVNRDVNRAITPYNKDYDVSAEEWLVSPSKGNCSDYAVTKRHELLARGWPSRALILTEVIVPSGEHHLVLVVRTRDVDLVLDNLNENLQTVSQVGYRWVRAQQERDPKFWSAIGINMHSVRITMSGR